MTANPKHDFYMTEAEYLELERDSEIRHEYLQGEVVAMAGASPNHNRITLSLSAILLTHLRGKDCEAFGESMRIKIEAADVQTYPDLSVVCGESQFTEDNPPALLNPIVLVEILSPSTERYDRGKKFQTYRKLPTLQDYVLVSQESAHIECFSRLPNQKWELSESTGLENSILVPSIDLTLQLVDVYENVKFE